MKFNCKPKQIKLLMVSFHFPPISQSSGYLRALKFAKYLPEYNILPTILTVSEQAYECLDKKNEQLLNDIDPTFEIHRAWGVNTSKTLSFRGKYFSWMAFPDNWASWIPFGFFKGLLLHRKKKFDAIWVTYPINSALFIGYFLHKITKRPIYTDLRDPVWEEETWQATTRQKLMRWIERKLILASKKVIFTSPGTIEKYKRRYPHESHKKFELLTNGYDESDFDGTDVQNITNDKKLFLHSGLLPEYERDPHHFFQAIKQLKAEGELLHSEVQFRLRATGENERYSRLIKQLGIDDLVEVASRVSYGEAIKEMSTADFLMIFQHKTCDWQIPAKLFEYLRLQKPMLLLAGQSSDTIATAYNANSSFVNAELDNVSQIKQAIKDCLYEKIPKANNNTAKNYSRRHLTQKLAQTLRQNKPY